MNSDLSFLRTMVTRVRAYIDEVDVDAKYTDDFLIRHFVMPAMTEAFSRINLASDNPVFSSFAVSVDSDATHYQLPPNVQEIHRLVTQLDDGTVLLDFYPRHNRNPEQAGWRIEGNQLVFPIAPAAYDLYVEYIPSGDFLPHLATSGGITESSVGDGYDTLQLSGSPTLGQLDRREKAYVGGVLRLIPASGKVQERVIENSYYSGGNWFVKVRTPFDSGTNPYTDTYEIAPMGGQALFEMIAIGAAIRLAVARKSPATLISNLRTIYLSARKTCVDQAANMQARAGKAWSRDTVDNPAMFPLSW